MNITTKQEEVEVKKVEVKKVITLTLSQEEADFLCAFVGSTSYQDDKKTFQDAGVKESDLVKACAFIQELHIALDREIE